MDKDRVYIKVVAPSAVDEDDYMINISSHSESDDYEYFKELVGGWLEEIVLDKDLGREGVVTYIDEEGKLKQLEPTFFLIDSNTDELVDIVVGPCVFCKIDDEGNSLGLDDDLLKKLWDWLHKLEIVAYETKSGLEKLAYCVRINR